MSQRTIAVVSAGLRQPSATRLLADRLGAAVRTGLRQHGIDAEIRPIELREHAHELTNALLTGFPPAALRPAVEAVAGADGLVAVTPIFNASYNGLFKSFFDVLDEGTLAGRPVLLAATGGTARHSLALEHAVRPLLSHLRTLTVPTAVFAASEDWAGGETAGPLQGRIERAAGELAALVAEQEPAAAPDPFALTTSFDELIAGD
ncbi:FMN reductase [Plantactinospora sp. KBS50]|uniref:FMN reductase n=1 Tax=Plantactinospora sp. KBS50 TaxID=2024580 RepID=UPI000BAAE4A5|nr:FMN reductase [Plantactinospora sp. KBS50]ASW57095.1 NADPH-dependent FMN reductase [Plantactinospora sp. KBS50]